MLALSFPKFGHPALAWLALLPLLVALGGGPGPRRRVPGAGRAFLLGLVTAAVYFGGTLYWVTAVMANFGDLSTPIAVGVNIIFVAYLALYPALFALVMAFLVRRIGAAAVLLAPAVWVATELGRARLFTGFPWVLLGYSQTPLLPIAQLASIVGVYGLSALVALVSAALAYLFIAAGSRRYVPIALTVAGVMAVGFWGGRRLHDSRLTHEGTAISVGLVQGDVPQNEKWDAARSGSVFQTYLHLSRVAASHGAQVIIWPEASTPFVFGGDPLGTRAVEDLARETHTTLLVGSDWIEQGATPRYYNAAIVVNPAGQVGGLYKKMHLVPFGEYVPLKTVFFFAAPLVQAVSNFSAGTEPTLLPLDGHPASTAICYEIVYPELVRRFVVEGSQLLTTITNDAWFGRSSAPYQHFEQASLRAVEEGRYLARAANTGISGFVDPYGRVISRSNLFEPLTMVGTVRFLTDRTIYSRIGDLFAWLCVAIAIGAFLAAWRTGIGRVPD
ncbi:MAG TPA: apolipoprotein N-acyltransferase [Vicinamibacterales bacterium]